MKLRSWMLVVAGVVLQVAVMVVGVVQALQAEGMSFAVGVVVTGTVLLLSVIAGVVAVPAAVLLYYGRYRPVAIGLLVVLGGALLLWTEGGPAFVPMQVFFALAAVQAWREQLADNSTSPESETPG